MLPMVRNANAAIQAERNFLIEMSEKTESSHEMSQRQLETAQSLSEKYRVNAAPEQTLQRLLDHVDIVPESLVLAQAANESAWGTPRFARTRYNFFGIWCFEVGCGEVPKARDAGKTHEVATFRSVQTGVEHYLLTINRHQALRDLRHDLRRQSKAFNGATLAEGLIKYSERGLPYVREIQAMISVNQLDQLSEQR
jgi:Bax protein